MAALVTLAQAKAHVRQDLDDEDEIIATYIEAASGLIIEHLGSQEDFLDSSGEAILDSSDNPVVPAAVKLATLYLVGLFYRDRDGEFLKEWQTGYLPTPVVSILYKSRDPVMR